MDNDRITYIGTVLEELIRLAKEDRAHDDRLVMVIYLLSMTLAEAESLGYRPNGRVRRPFRLHP